MTDATHHPAAVHRPPGSVRAVVPADPRRALARFTQGADFLRIRIRKRGAKR